MSTLDLSSDIGFRDGRLFIGGFAVEALARRFGTPLYVYSAETMRARLRALQSAFAGHPTLVCYALKANTNGAVCRLLARGGAGADVVSGGELQRALAAGFDRSRIVFSGVGKTPGELALAARSGLLAVNVESEEELSALSCAARAAARRVAVSIRLNPDVPVDTHQHVVTGRADTKFGVEARDARRLLVRVAKDPRLEGVGLHCHLGSQLTSGRPYVKALEGLLSLAASARRAGWRLDFLDVGGGLGVRYGAEKPLLPQELAAALLPLVRDSGARLLLEPGRFLTADAGLLLTKVLYRKRTSRARFLVVDAAMNDLARPALYGAYHPITPARARRGKEVVVDVVGPVCESGDFLAKGRRLPWLEPGALLAVEKAGAYGFSMSSQYNSRPRAAEVLVDGSRARLVRRRETLRDLTRLERG